MPDAARRIEAQAKMKEGACVLTKTEREIVESQVEETCKFRDWYLHAVECRSNHMHVVVGADNTNPKKIRADLKAWCTRRLKEKSESNRENWWAERGSVRWVFDEDSLDTVLKYVVESQDLKGKEY